VILEKQLVIPRKMHEAQLLLQRMLVKFLDVAIEGQPKDPLVLDSRRKLPWEGLTPLIVLHFRTDHHNLAWHVRKELTHLTPIIN
jgi:hypothetical protein